MNEGVKGRRVEEILKWHGGFYFGVAVCHNHLHVADTLRVTHTAQLKKAFPRTLSGDQCLFVSTHLVHNITNANFRLYVDDIVVYVNQFLCHLLESLDTVQNTFHALTDAES